MLLKQFKAKYSDSQQKLEVWDNFKLKQKNKTE